MKFTRESWPTQKQTNKNKTKQKIDAASLGDDKMSGMLCEFNLQLTFRL